MFVLAVPFRTGCGSAMARAPIPGQPYQVPPGYEGCGPGTLVAYCGYSYVIQGDGTMLLSCSSVSCDQQPVCDQQPADDQGACQVFHFPDGYSGCAAANVITYGDANYVLQGDGTMVLCAQGDGSDSGSCLIYPVPDGYSGCAAGSLITYGGANYTIGLNGTMVLLANTKYPSNHGHPAGAYGHGPHGGFAINTWRPGAGFQHGPRGASPTTHGAPAAGSAGNEQPADSEAWVRGAAGVAAEEEADVDRMTAPPFTDAVCLRQLIRRGHTRVGLFKGVGEIALRVTNLDVMQRFYQDAVGLELLGRSERGVFFRIAGGYGGHTQVLALFDRSAQPDYRGLDAATPTIDHIAFETGLADFQPEKERLERLGLEVQTALHAWVHWRSLYVADPEGNLVEWVCYDETVG